MKKEIVFVHLEVNGKPAILDGRVEVTYEELVEIMFSSTEIANGSKVLGKSAV